MNFEPMSMRRSIAEEILDTIYFGSLNCIKGARGRKISKIQTSQKDAYLLPFGISKNCYGAVLVHAPYRIEIIWRDKGVNRRAAFQTAHDAKAHLCYTFVDK